MLQDRASCDKSLPWVKVGLRCLEAILHNHAAITGHLPPQILAVERMIQGAIRAFGLDQDVSEAEDTTRPESNLEEGLRSIPGPISIHPVSQAASVRGGVPTMEDPLPMPTDNPAGANNMDMDWNIDISAMDMEAFLSIDMTQEFNFGM